MFAKYRTPLCLMALVSMGGLLGTGCSTSGSASASANNTQADSSKVLNSLVPSAGILSPSFDPAIHSYTLDIFSAIPSLTLTPTLSPKATVTVASVATPSGQPSAAITLTPNTPVTVPITLTAEDKSTADYSVKITQYPATKDIWVLNSVNGSPIANTTLKVADAAGTVLQSGIAVDGNGRAQLGLPATRKYTLIANAPNAAESSIGNFDPDLDATAWLYCHPLGMTSFGAAAPQITQMSYSEDGTTWVPITGNSITNAMAKIRKIRVTAIAKCGINQTWTAGFGMATAVDHPASALSSTAPDTMLETSVPVVINGLNYFQTTAIFPVTFVNPQANATHYLDVVVYDVANNRTEQKIYLHPTDASASVATDKDLSTYSPTDIYVQLYTYGQSLDTFSMAGNVSYKAAIFFSLGSGTDIPNTRGLEVWRARNGGTFTKVATYHFGAPINTNVNSSPVVPGSYVWQDNDPTIDLASTYTYKVRSLAANFSTATSNFSNFSPEVPAKFLAPWTLTLLAPAHNAVAMTRTPVFSFVNSNPGLFAPTVATGFRFYLSIKDKVGNPVYSQAYRYNWMYKPTGATAATPRWEKLVGSSYVDASNEVSISADLTTISVLYPATARLLLPGQTYEWSIFGTSTSTAASFSIGFAAPTGTSSSSFSYGSTGNQSNGATNGYFTLIIDPSVN